MDPRLNDRRFLRTAENGPKNGENQMNMPWRFRRTFHGTRAVNPLGLTTWQDKLGAGSIDVWSAVKFIHTGLDSVPRYRV
jgi:hypothetical protein